MSISIPDGLGARRRSLLGLPMLDVTLAECLDLVARSADSRTSTLIVTCNVDHIMLLRKNPAFVDSYRSADVITADGAPIVALGRLCGQPMRARVTGADIVLSLAALAQAGGFRLAFVGGEPGVADAAARRVQEDHPGLALPTSACPAMGFRIGSDEDLALIDKLKSADPHIVVVCLGAPRQEAWMAAHRDDLPGAVMIGAGAAIDFIVGKQRRAPLWIQRSGLEWTWRLSHDFPRLARRYLVQDAGFLPVAIRELVSQRRHRRTALVLTGATTGTGTAAHGA